MDNIEDISVIGVSQLRKITAQFSTMEMLELAGRFAEEGYDKKLWSLLSRVYEDKKGFTDIQDGLEIHIEKVMNSNVPAEYKMQLFTSFNIPHSFAPKIELVRELIAACSKKRSNIAAFFIIAYGYEKDVYKDILANKEILKTLSKYMDAARLACLYEYIIDNASKEIITGAVRTLNEFGTKQPYKDITDVKRLVEKAFASKEVFYTTKLLLCLALSVPENCLPAKRDIYKILKITVNYEERITKDFVKKYNLEFDCSDEAMCRYYIGNKKTSNEKLLVSKFANHLCRVSDPEVKSKLLRNAFRRGGYFRMYAGCMQDGMIIVDKLHRFHYSDEDIKWVSGLSGLKKQEEN